MGQKIGLSLDDVMTVAVDLADREGLDAVSLAAVARELGIKTPSLYNHVDGLDGLHRQLAIRGSRILVERFNEAIGEQTGVDALRAIARAHRSFATEHPGLYASFLPAPSEQSDPELYAALAVPVAMIADVLAAMGVNRSNVIHSIRALRATIHGFADLETKQGFGMPEDIDASFETAIESVVTGIVQPTV